MDDAREEMRKLIDVIENGAKSTSVEQAVDDIKLFANTASFLANALDTRLKTKDANPKSKSKPRKTLGQPKPPAPSIPKSANTPKAQDTTTGMPPAISTAISQADYDRLKPKAAQAPLRTSQKPTCVKNYVANSAETLQVVTPVSEFTTRCFMSSDAQLNANQNKHA